jgi:hypothetical protein
MLLLHCSDWAGLAWRQSFCDLQFELNLRDGVACCRGTAGAALHCNDNRLCPLLCFIVSNASAKLNLISSSGSQPRCQQLLVNKGAGNG